MACVLGIVWILDVITSFLNIFNPSRICPAERICICPEGTSPQPTLTWLQEHAETIFAVLLCVLDGFIYEMLRDKDRKSELEVKLAFF